MKFLLIAVFTMMLGTYVMANSSSTGKHVKTEECKYMKGDLTRSASKNTKASSSQGNSPKTKDASLSSGTAIHN